VNTTHLVIIRQNQIKVEFLPDHLLPKSEILVSLKLIIQFIKNNAMSDDEFIYDDYEDSDSSDEEPCSSQNPHAARVEDDFTFEVLSTEKIMEHMVDCIQEVNNVIQIPVTTVRILLNHFNWDKEKLMERYYSDDQEAMFVEAKVVPPHKKIIDPSASTSRTRSAKMVTCECQICLLTLPKKEMTGLECGDMYCKSCWKEYLTTKIMDEGASQMIECPGSTCDILVDDQTVMNLVFDSGIKRKYQQLITNSFVQCNRLMRWCPAPNCSNAVRVSHIEARPVKCVCGHLFCFICSENWHEPVRCNLIKKWIKKCNDDSETSNWINAYTKECPQCKATIEKDGGCNHIVCRNQSCKAHFCWVCLGPWEPHGNSWYNCNRYDEDDSKQAREGHEKSRSALQRYLFYCNRYRNHMQSLKFENKLYSMAKEKMEEMQNHNMSWIETQFLKKAVDILCDCRRTLMHTYVFAYYLRKNNQCHIFEDNQRDLETATELLSEYLERDISAANLADIKQKVQDKSRYCENRRKVLLDHVHEGYEKEWWLYTDPDC